MIQRFVIPWLDSEHATNLIPARQRKAGDAIKRQRAALVQANYCEKPWHCCGPRGGLASRLDSAHRTHHRMRQRLGSWFAGSYCNLLCW